MNSRIILISIVGIITILLAGTFFDIYAGLFMLIILLTVLMCLAIYRDAGNFRHPHLIASLSDDGAEVRIENIGTAPARSIHVIIIPGNTEYDIPVLEPDEVHDYTLPGMIDLGRATVTHLNMNGITKKQTFRIGDPRDEDPLQPAFPLFNWREKK